jgi:hypothetical protein
MQVNMPGIVRLHFEWSQTSELSVVYRELSSELLPLKLLLSSEPLWAG